MGGPDEAARSTSTESSSPSRFGWLKRRSRSTPPSAPSRAAQDAWPEPAPQTLDDDDDDDDEPRSSDGSRPSLERPSEDRASAAARDAPAPPEPRSASDERKSSDEPRPRARKRDMLMSMVKKTTKSTGLLEKFLFDGGDAPAAAAEDEPEDDAPDAEPEPEPGSRDLGSSPPEPGSYAHGALYAGGLLGKLSPSKGLSFLGARPTSFRDDDGGRGGGRRPRGRFRAEDFLRARGFLRIARAGDGLLVALCGDEPAGCGVRTRGELRVAWYRAVEDGEPGAIDGADEAWYAPAPEDVGCKVYARVAPLDDDLLCRWAEHGPVAPAESVRQETEAAVARGRYEVVGDGDAELQVLLADGEPGSCSVGSAVTAALDEAGESLVFESARSDVARGLRLDGCLDGDVLIGCDPDADFEPASADGRYECVFQLRPAAAVHVLKLWGDAGGDLWYVAGLLERCEALDDDDVPLKLRLTLSSKRQRDVLALSFRAFRRKKRAPLLRRVRAEMAELYGEHNPKKLGDIDALLRKYAHRELELLAAIRFKYRYLSDEQPSSECRPSFTGDVSDELRPRRVHAHGGALHGDSDDDDDDDDGPDAAPSPPASPRRTPEEACGDDGDALGFLPWASQRARGWTAEDDAPGRLSVVAELDDLRDLRDVAVESRDAALAENARLRERVAALERRAAAAEAGRDVAAASRDAAAAAAARTAAAAAAAAAERAADAAADEAKRREDTAGLAAGLAAFGALAADRAAVGRRLDAARAAALHEARRRESTARELKRAVREDRARERAKLQLRERLDVAVAEADAFKAALEHHVSAPRRTVLSDIAEDGAASPPAGGRSWFGGGRPRKGRSSASTPPTSSPAAARREEPPRARDI